MIFGSESPEPGFSWTRKSADVDQKVGLRAGLRLEAAVVDDDERFTRDHALETQDERVESLLVDLAIVLNGRHPRLPDAWRPNLPAGEKVLISVLRTQHNKSIRKFRPILKRLAAECKIAFAPLRPRRSRGP